MKKTVTKELAVCDYCASDDFCYRACPRCGKDVCFDCMETHGHRFSAHVWGGSCDAWYCTPCFNALHDLGDPLLLAYVRIKNMRAEEERLSKELADARRGIEEHLRKLLDKQPKA